MSDLEQMLQKEQAETKTKEEMLAQATEALTEFNDEKHDVKAKFKHLMQLINLKQIQVDASQSY